MGMVERADNIKQTEVRADRMPEVSWKHRYLIREIVMTWSAPQPKFVFRGLAPRPRLTAAVVMLLFWGGFYLAIGLGSLLMKWAGASSSAPTWSLLMPTWSTR